MDGSEDVVVYKIQKNQLLYMDRSRKEEEVVEKIQKNHFIYEFNFYILIL